MKAQKEVKKSTFAPKSPPIPYFASDSEKEIGDFLTKCLAKYIHKMNGAGKGQLYDLVIKGVEKPLIGIVLEATEGNQVQAAELLGINRNTLRKKIKLLGINISSN